MLPGVNGQAKQAEYRCQDKETHGPIVMMQDEKTQIQNVEIRKASREDEPVLLDMAAQIWQGKDAGYFASQLERQETGERDILIAAADGRDVAYGILNWKPKYGLFKTLGLPEIQDLNVLPDLRRRGIASAVIVHCEAQARDRGYTQMGISVGLHSSYGPAQKLYFKLGYEPDGQGATYDRNPLTFGEFRPVDDHLCLMMLKNL